LGFWIGGGLGLGAGIGAGCGCGLGSSIPSSFSMSSTTKEKSISFVLKHDDVGLFLDSFFITNFCKLGILVFSHRISLSVLFFTIAVSFDDIPL